MIIDLIANDGSPIGVTPNDIYDRGVGGAELAMMTLMETFAERGHIVSVYNDPRPEGVYDNVKYAHRSGYNPRANRDILIVFRSPNPLLLSSVAKVRKIWWSTDQYTIGDFKALSERVDFCVTISDFHTQHHKHKWKIDTKKMGHIDLPIRVNDYDLDVQKEPGSMIYCSVPDRGLQILHAAWPLIRRKTPKANLTITSDYSLWGVEPRNAKHRLVWAGMEGVTFLGKIPRKQLVELQLKAEVNPYPSIYDELFCISVAECQVAGCFPITTPRAALKTTNDFGIQISGDPRSPQFVEEFADRVGSMVSVDREYMETRKLPMVAGAKRRFDPNRVAEIWEHLFENGKLPRR